MISSVCCCALSDACQNEVSSTPSVSPWGLRQNGWDQWAHNIAASVWRYTIVSDYPWQKEHGLTSNHKNVCLTACQHIRPFSSFSCWIQSKICRIPARNQLNCRGWNQSHSRMTHWCFGHIIGLSHWEWGRYHTKRNRKVKQGCFAIRASEGQLS